MSKTAWQVEKRINLGDILTMVGMFIAMLGFVGSGWLYLHTRIDNTEKTLTVHAAEISHIREDMRRDRETIKDGITEIKVELRSINSKLDTKADK